MKILVALFVLVCCSVVAYSQPGIQKFLVAEYRVDSPKMGNYAYLTSYNFKKGKFMGKDTLLQKPSSKEEDRAFRVGYSGTDLVYKKRYLLTNYGCVIDLKAGKIRYKTGDLLVEALGDR